MKFYVDTSAWGGYYDKEFFEWTTPFIEQARQGKFTIVLSDVTLEELQNAPEEVRDLPTTIPPEFIETVTITDEQLTLAEHYIKEGALTQKYYQSKEIESEFHAVDFMRKARGELSEKYLRDKEKYLQDLKKAMEDFKCRQKKAYSRLVHSQ